MKDSHCDKTKIFLACDKLNCDPLQISLTRLFLYMFLSWFIAFSDFCAPSERKAC